MSVDESKLPFCGVPLPELTREQLVVVFRAEAGQYVTDPDLCTDCSLTEDKCKCAVFLPWYRREKNALIGMICLARALREKEQSEDSIHALAPDGEEVEPRDKEASKIYKVLLQRGWRPDSGQFHVVNAAIFAAVDYYEHRAKQALRGITKAQLVDFTRKFYECNGSGDGVNVSAEDCDEVYKCMKAVGIAVDL